MFENITFKNINFVGYGIETSSTAIRFYGARNCNITNCEFSDFGIRATVFLDCLDCVIDSNTFRRVFYTGMGYGINIANACDNITITNNSFLELGRHYIAVGSNTGHKISDGFSRHITIQNNVFEDCADEAINTHYPNRCVSTITGNDIYNCRKGIELSNGDSVIKNNNIVGSYVTAIETYGSGSHLVEGNYFNENYRSFRCEATTEIRGNLFDNGGYILPTINTIIENNTFKNYSGYIIYAVGSSSSYLQNIEISNNICEDSLTMAMKLNYAKNVNVNNNNFRGYLEFGSCDNVEVDGNRINSPASSGVRVIDAKG